METNTARDLEQVEMCIRDRLGADEDLEDEASVEEDLIIIDDEDLDKDFDEEDEEE